MSNTYYDKSGQEITREQFRRELKSRTAPEPKMTYTGVTVYPSGREEVVEYDDKPSSGGNVIRKETRQTGYQVTDTRTGESQTLYTSQLPTGQRQQFSPNISPTASLDPAERQRFIQVIDTKGKVRENYYYDTQRGASVSKKERDRIIAAEGDIKKISVEGEVSPRNLETETSFTRIIDDFEMPSFFEAATGRKAKITSYGEEFIKSGVREQRETIINKPYLVPAVITSSFVFGGLSVVAPKIATGVAISGKLALGASLGFQAGRATAAGLGYTKESPVDILGRTAGSLSLLGVSGYAGLQAGSFTASKLFPIKTTSVTVNVPKQTNVQRDVLTERLTAKQVIDLSKQPAPLKKATVTVRREVSGFDISNKFEASYSSPQFGFGKTATTKIITETMPASNIPKVSQDFSILGRLTPQGIQQVRAFQPIIGKKGSSLSIFSPSFSSDTGVISTTQPSFSLFPSSRFASVPISKPLFLVPAVTSGSSSTNNIEKVSSFYQPINLTTDSTKTTDLIDYNISSRTTFTADTGASPLVSSTSVPMAKAATAADTTTLSITSTASPATSIRSRFATGFKVPSFPSFNIPPLPNLPSFSLPAQKATIRPKRKMKPKKIGKTRKGKEIWEDLFTFDNLNLDISRRRVL